MPAIIFSRIYAFGTVYDVFPVGEPPSSPESFYDLRDKSAETVFLLPSLCADASVVSYKNPHPSPTAAFAGAVFLTRVRGLPLDETDIESHGGKFKISQERENGNLHLFLPKCKPLCAKREISVEKMKISVSDIDAYGLKISVVKCAEPSSFTDTSFTRIMLGSGDFLPDGAVAYSLSEGRAAANVRFINPRPENTLFSALAIARAEGVDTLSNGLLIKISNSELHVLSRGSHFSVNDGKMKHLTLAAPDIS